MGILSGADTNPPDVLAQNRNQSSALISENSRQWQSLFPAPEKRDYRRSFF